jgi:hypothetical protein
MDIYAILEAVGTNIFFVERRKDITFEAGSSWYLLRVPTIQERNLNHRTPTPSACLGPRLLWLLCAEFSESILALSPLPALALALPVRLRTFGRGAFGGYELLTPAYCSTCCGATAFPWPGGCRGTGARISPGGDGLPLCWIYEPLGPLGGEGRPVGPFGG